MSRKAVTQTATGAVMQYGYCDFTSEIDPLTQSQVDLNEGTILVADIPLYHHKVVAGNFVEMSAAEKATVDAAREAESTAKLDGAVHIQRVVNSISELPLPPPKAGLLVGVITTGNIGLAISGTNKWFLFAVDGMVGP